MSNDRYGLIFDAEVEIQDVTLADTENTYSQVVEDMSANTKTLEDAAEHAGQRAGKSMVQGIRKELSAGLASTSKNKFPLGAIHLQMASALETSVKKAMSNLDLSDVDIEANVETDGLGEKVTRELIQAGDNAGVVLGQKLSKSVSSSLNRSLGQISRRIAEKELALKGKLHVDRSEIEKLEEPVQVPATLKLTDDLSSEVQKNLEVNLKVKNHSVIKRNLSNIKADIQLTEKAKSAISQLNSIPTHHVVKLRVDSNKNDARIAKNLSNLTKITLDISKMDMRQLYLRSKDAGARAGNVAARSFERSWRRVIGAIDHNFEVKARINQLEAPATMPTIGVKAQTEQVAKKAAQKTVQETKRQEESQPRPSAPSPDKTRTQKPVEVIEAVPVQPVTDTRPSQVATPPRRISAAKRGRDKVARKALDETYDSPEYLRAPELNNGSPFVMAPPAPKVGSISRILPPNKVLISSAANNFAGPDRLTKDNAGSIMSEHQSVTAQDRKLQERFRRERARYNAMLAAQEETRKFHLRRDSVDRKGNLGEVEGMRSHTEVKHNASSLTSTVQDRLVARRFAAQKERNGSRKFASAVRELERITAYKDESTGVDVPHSALVQLSGEAILGYNQRRNAGYAPQDINTVPVSATAAEGIMELAAKNGKKVEIPFKPQYDSNGKQVGKSYYLPRKNAETLMGPALRGTASMLEVNYLTQGDPAKMRVHKLNTAKNITERNMVSGMVIREAGGIQKPEDFVAAYRRTFQTDHFVPHIDEDGNKTMRPAFAGPVYDWRFMEMAAATGYLSSDTIQKYEEAMEQAKRKPEQFRGHAESKALDILRGSYKNFLTTELGMLPETAKHYTRFINPDRAKRSVDRFVVRDKSTNWKPVLKPVDERANLLVRSGLYGEFSHADSSFFGGNVPEPASHEELNMHNMLSTLVEDRSRYIPSWELASRALGSHSNNALSSPLTEEERKRQKGNIGVIKEKAKRIMDFPELAERAGVALVDSVSFSDETSAAMQKRVSSLLSELNGLPLMNYNAASQRVFGVSAQLQELREAAFETTARNARGFRGTLPWTQGFMRGSNPVWEMFREDFDGTSGEIKRGSETERINRAMSQMGMRHLRVTELLDLDETRQLEGAGIKALMENYVSAVQRGDIDEADKIRQTPLRTIKNGRRIEGSGGKVTYQDEVFRLSDLMDAQMQMLDYGTVAFLDHNTEMVQSGKEREYTGKYDHNGALRRGMTQRRLANLNADLAAKVQASYPERKTTRHITERFANDLRKNGLSTEGIQYRDLQDVALHELEEKQRRLTKEEYRVQQLSVLSARYPDVYDLFDLDDAGNPTLVGPDYKGDKLSAPMRGKFFKLKEGGNEEIIRRGTVSAKKSLLGNKDKTISGVLDGYLQEMLNNMGYVYEKDGPKARAARYGGHEDWTIEEMQAGFKTKVDAATGYESVTKFQPNANFMSEAPEHIQEIIDVRNKLQTDPLGTAREYVGRSISDLQAKVEAGKASDNEKRRLKYLQGRMSRWNNGEAVNPFEVLDHVRISTGAGAGFQRASSFLASSSNPVLEPRIITEGIDSGLESEQLVQRRYGAFSYLDEDGVRQSAVMGLRGRLPTEEEAIRHHARYGVSTSKGRGGNLNHFAEMSKRVRSHRSTLTPKGLSEQDAVKMDELGTLLHDMAGRDNAELYDSKEGRAMLKRYTALANELSPLLGYDFASQVKMYGKGGFRPAKVDSIGMEHHRTIMGRTARMTDNGAEMLRNLYALQEHEALLVEQGYDKRKTPEGELIRQARNAASVRIENLQGHIRGLGITPGLEPVKSEGISTEEYDSLNARLSYGERIRSGKIQPKQKTKYVDPYADDVSVKPKAAKSPSVSQSEVELFERLTDTVKSKPSQPKRIRVKGKANNRFTMAGVFSNLVRSVDAVPEGDTTLRATQRALESVALTGPKRGAMVKSARRKAAIRTKEMQQAGAEPVLVGQTEIKIDLSQFEKDMKNMLVSLGKVAQETQLKLRQVLDGIRGLTVDHSQLNQSSNNASSSRLNRSSNNEYGRDERDKDGNKEELAGGDRLFRNTAPYEDDSKLSQTRLGQLNADLVAGKLTPDAYTSEVIKELETARLDYIGGAAQAGSVASTAGDRLKDDERRRAVRVLGPANVTDKDFFRYSVTPAKQRAAMLLDSLSKKHNLDRDELVQAVMPHLRNSSHYDHGFITSMVEDPNFLGYIQSGRVKQASDYLHNRKRGGLDRREVMLNAFTQSGADPMRFEEAQKLFGMNFMETALNPNSSAELRPDAQRILKNWLSGALDRNAARRDARKLLHDFDNQRDAGSRHTEGTNAADRNTRLSLFEDVFGKSALRQSGKYAGLDTRSAAELFVAEDPQMANILDQNLGKLRSYQSLLSDTSRSRLASSFDKVVSSRNGVLDGTQDEDDFQEAGINFDTQTKSLRNSVRLRSKFISFLDNPNMVLDDDPVRDAVTRNEMNRMRAIASRKQLNKIRAGDEDAMTELANRSRHVGERITMYQNGIVNMAAFAASTLVQMAVTGIIEGLIQQEEGVRAVRAAANLAGEKIPKAASLRRQGYELSQKLGVSRTEALALIEQSTGGEDISQHLSKLKSLKGILNATGETTAELGAYYAGLRQSGVIDPSRAIKFTTSRGMTLAQAEENRMLVEDGLKEFNSDRDKALAIVGAQQVSGLKDWRLSDAITTRERQMERLREYGKEQDPKAQTSMGMDTLQKLNQQTQATLQSLSSALEPLVKILGGLAMVTLKVIKAGSDFVNLTGPIGKLILAIGLLAGTMKMLTGIAEMSVVQNALGGMVDMGRKFLSGVKAVPGQAKSIFSKVKDHPLSGKVVDATKQHGGAAFNKAKQYMESDAFDELRGKAAEQLRRITSKSKANKPTQTPAANQTGTSTSPATVAVDNLAGNMVGDLLGGFMYSVGDNVLGRRKAKNGKLNNPAKRNSYDKTVFTPNNTTPTPPPQGRLNGAKDWLMQMLGGIGIQQALSKVTGKFGGFINKGKLANAGKTVLDGAKQAPRVVGNLIGSEAARRAFADNLKSKAPKVMNNARTFLGRAAARTGAGLAQAGNAVKGSRIAGMAMNIGRMAPMLLTNPAGIAALAVAGVGAATYGVVKGAQALANRKEEQVEKVTGMSASGADEVGAIEELAAAYSGELTPAMEAAGWSVEEVRKNIDKMAKSGKGRTKELAKEVKELAKDYALAAEFAKSLSYNLQTRVPVRIAQYKNRDQFSVVDKKSNIERLEKRMGKLNRADENVFQERNDVRMSHYKSLDDRFFRYFRSKIAGENSQTFIGRLFKMETAHDAYYKNADILAYTNQKRERNIARGTENDARRKYEMLPGSEGSKAPSFIRRLYNDLRESGRNGNVLAGSAAGWMHLFGGFGTGRYDERVVTRWDAPDDRTYDHYATIQGIRDGRLESLAAIQKQFSKEGLKDFSQKSLDRLARNPKAYLEVMNALGEVNKQESDAWSGFYQNNVQRAVLNATAPGVFGQKYLYDENGVGKFSDMMVLAGSNPDQFTQDMMYNQSGIQLRQAEAQLAAQKENLRTMMTDEIAAMQQSGLITTLEETDGVVTGFKVNTEKLSDVSENTRQRLEELRRRVAEAGGEMGQLAIQIRQLNIEDIIKQAVAEANLGSVASGDVTLGGVLSGTQSLVTENTGIDAFVGSLQSGATYLAGNGEGVALTGIKTRREASKIMANKLGASNVYQLPGEDKTGFYHGKGHPGYDFNYRNHNADIKSLTNGTVTFVGVDPKAPGYGLRVLVDSGNGYIHAYSHLSKANVKVGDSVSMYSKLGTQGGGLNQDRRTRGASTGYHLDYSLYASNGKGGIKGKALRDLDSLLNSGALNTEGGNTSSAPSSGNAQQLDQELQKLRENKSFQALNVSVENLPNRVAALKAKYEGGKITKTQYNEGLNKIVSDGYVAVNTANNMIKDAFGKAGVKYGKDAVLDGRAIFASVLTKSGVINEFNALVESGGASKQVANLVRSAEMRLAAGEIRNSGDGTILGNAQAARTADRVTALGTANITFDDTVNNATTSFLQKIVPRGGNTSKYTVTRRTPDGYSYTAISDEALGLLTSEERNTYQQQINAAVTNRKAEVAAAGYQEARTESQAKVQDWEQKIQAELAKTPRTPAEKLEYQIKTWKKVLGGNIDPQTKQQVASKISGLENQLSTLQYNESNKRAGQRVNNSLASNALLDATLAGEYADISYNGDGTLTGNAIARNEGTFSSEMVRAAGDFASGMSRLAEQFRNQYTDIPEDAFTKKYTAFGQEYMELKEGYVDPKRTLEYKTRRKGLGQIFENRATQAERNKEKADGRVYVQSSQQDLDSQLAAQELHPYLKNVEARDFWKGKLSDELDPEAKAQINEKIRVLDNQIMAGLPDYLRQKRRMGINSRKVIHTLDTLLGGSADLTDFEIRSIDADMQIVEMQKVMGKDSPEVQAAWSRANQFRQLAPIMDNINSMVETGKLDSVGTTGATNFEIRSAALDAALKQAKEQIGDETIIRRLLGEQIVARDQQLLQYEMAGRAAANRLKQEERTAEIMQQQVGIAKNLTNGNLAETMSARVQKDMEQVSLRANFDQQQLDIETDQRNDAHTTEALQRMAQELGIDYRGLNHDDLKDTVAEGRKARSRESFELGIKNSEQMFMAASGERLASLISQPLSPYETLGSRVSAIQETREDAGTVAEPLEQQLTGVLGLDAATLIGFDSAITDLRDRSRSGQVIGDAELMGLAESAKELTPTLQNVLGSSFDELATRTQAGVEAQVLSATKTGLSVGEELELTDMQLSMARLRLGAKDNNELAAIAESNLRQGINVEQARSALELVNTRNRVSAKLQSIEAIEAPIERYSMRIQDTERNEGSAEALEERYAAGRAMEETFFDLSMDSTVSEVLAMSQEELTDKYGHQAESVKRLAEYLRTLGIEIEENTKLIESETRARNAQQAQLRLSRTAERGGSASDVLAAQNSGAKTLREDLSSMLKDPTRLDEALELARKGDKLALGELIGSDKDRDEFMSLSAGYDQFNQQGLARYLTAATREQAEANAGLLLKQFPGIGEGTFSSGVEQLNELLALGDKAALDVFDNMLANSGRGERLANGTYKMLNADGKTYKTYQNSEELLKSLVNDESELGDAARFVLGGGGGMGLAGTYLSGMMPKSQSAVSHSIASGDFESAQQHLNNSYELLATLINRLLEESGSNFHIGMNPKEASLDASLMDVAKLGANPATLNVLEMAQPLVTNFGVPTQDAIDTGRARRTIVGIERKYQANKPMYRSENQMLQFEQSQLAATNQSLLESGTVRVGEGGQLSGPSEMVDVYKRNLERMNEITAERSTLLVRQWNDMLSEFAESLRDNLTEATSLLVSEALTGQHYRKKIEELDRNYGNQVENVNNTMEVTEANKVRAKAKMDEAAKTKGTGSQDYLDAKQEYEFYNQKILEMKDNVAQLNTEWEQQKFELKTINEMLLDIFDNLANQIINKTIGRFVDWGLDSLFGGASGIGGNAGGGGFPIGRLLGIGGGVVAASTAGAMSGGAVAGAMPVGSSGMVLTPALAGGGAVGASGGGVLGIKGLSQGDVGAGMTSYALTSQSGNPLVGVGVGAVQMGIAGGVAGMAAAGGSSAAFGPAAAAALTNPVGWAALAIGATVGLIANVAKNREEIRRREHIAEGQGVHMYGLKQGQYTHRAPKTQVNAKVEVQSLGTYSTSRELSRQVIKETRREAVKKGLSGISGK